MKVGDKVSLKGNSKYKGLIFRIKKHPRNSNWFTLSPKPKGYCCNFFSESELTLVK